MIRSSFFKPDVEVRYLRVQSMRWPAAAVLLVLIGAAGCGSQYRPVINPVVPTGPAAQPTSYAVVFSQPGLVTPTDPSLPTTAPPCPGLAGGGVFQSYTNPGVVTILDFSGDSIMALANVGNGPLGLTWTAPALLLTARTVTVRSARCRSAYRCRRTRWAAARC
jgi:hypothetical protein